MSVDHVFLVDAPRFITGLRRRQFSLLQPLVNKEEMIRNFPGFQGAFALCTLYIRVLDALTSIRKPAHLHRGKGQDVGGGAPVCSSSCWGRSWAVVSCRTLQLSGFCCPAVTTGASAGLGEKLDWSCWGQWRGQGGPQRCGVHRGRAAPWWSLLHPGSDVWVHALSLLLPAFRGGMGTSVSFGWDRQGEWLLNSTGGIRFWSPWQQCRVLPVSRVPVAAVR